ncbi:MAG TPA: AarF/UbiB family protein [Candidatus Thermoplasmatota archaeon]|jgi:ubiquinone biosynthesis protein|nr:AarF/UbiB family protein [Candidatus Thermoplasmatota archaeon]
MPSRSLLKLKRTAEVIGILFEHDALGVMRDMNQASRIPMGPNRSEVLVPEGVPRRVRMMMEDLGPTFIKMGQLLATRPDLIPKPFVEEFRNFYDRTRPSPFPEIKELIERELGKTLGEVFTSFSEQPIASASIGQVHVATLRTGEKVAVKVQHPGTDTIVAIDFDILRPMVRFFQNMFAASRIYQPSEHLHEIEDMMQRELDYTHEARILARFYRNFEGEPGGVDPEPNVKIPKLYPAFCTRRIITMEFIEGLPLSQATPEELEKRGIDRRALARTLTNAMAKQIFEHRLFHADPSPGNLIITGPRQIAFIDFGAVGHVSRRRAERVMHLIHGFTYEDLDEVTQALLELCNIFGPVDPNVLKKDIERIMDYQATERAAVGDPVIMDLIAKTAQNNHMLLPADFFLISRALFQFEGICTRLDPEFDIVREFTPIVIGHLRRQALSAEGAGILKETGLAYLELFRDLPGKISGLLRKLETNQLEVRVHEVATERGRREDRRGFQRAFTGLMSAMIVGAGLTFLAPRPEEALGNFLFFGSIFGLLWAAVMLYYSD